jgi:pre-mRNA-splicing factor CWC26
MGSDSGLGQETVHRDKQGRRVDPKLERLRKRQEEKEKEAKLEAKMKWGRGVSQIEQREQKLREEVYEMAKPFARGKDDADMNRALKDELRADDPMRAYIESQREKAARASGVKVKPKYKGEWPPNRYGIPPGHRWDGRDRSSGFESKLALRQNAKIAHNKDAYKWSSEAM